MLLVNKTVLAQGAKKSGFLWWMRLESSYFPIRDARAKCKLIGDAVETAVGSLVHGRGNWWELDLVDAELYRLALFLGMGGKLLLFLTLRS